MANAHDALRLVSDRFLKIVRLKMKLFASGEVLGHLPLEYFSLTTIVSGGK